MSSISNGVKTKEAVLYEQKDKVAIVTLNRPDRYNAANDDLNKGLMESLTKARNDESVRAVVITGNGKGFCAGADMMDFGIATPSDVRDYINANYGIIVRKIVEMRKPVICAINGPAAGVGLAFALACDLRVMADTANMRYAFINIGLGPDGGSGWLLTRTVGYSKAFEIAVEGEKIPASKCLELGLTNKVAPLDQLMEVTMDWANKLAERPTLGVGITKEGLHYSTTHGLYDSIAFEAEKQMEGLASHDHKEGVAAFLQKRKPNFIGK